MTQKKELSPSEAVYGFVAWLSGREEVTKMGSKNDCANLADKIQLFCETNNLTDPKDHWEKNLIHPS